MYKTTYAALILHLCYGNRPNKTSRPTKRKIPKYNKANENGMMNSLQDRRNTGF